MSHPHLALLVQEQAKKYANRTALRYRDYATGTWVPVTWNQFSHIVDVASRALLELGVGVQENIGVFSQNKPECLYMDFAAFGVRAVSIPLYATSSAEQVGYKDVTHFSSTFKKVSGMSPSEYQDTCR